MTGRITQIARTVAIETTAHSWGSVLSNAKGIFRSFLLRIWHVFTRFVFDKVVLPIWTLSIQSNHDWTECWQEDKPLEFTLGTPKLIVGSLADGHWATDLAGDDESVAIIIILQSLRHPSTLASLVPNLWKPHSTYSSVFEYIWILWLVGMPHARKFWTCKMAHAETTGMEAILRQMCEGDPWLL